MGRGVPELSSCTESAFLAAQGLLRHVGWGRWGGGHPKASGLSCGNGGGEETERHTGWSLGCDLGHWPQLSPVTQLVLSKAFLTPPASQPRSGTSPPLATPPLATPQHTPPWPPKSSHAHLTRLSASLLSLPPPLPQSGNSLPEGVSTLTAAASPAPPPCLLFGPWNVEFRKPQAMWPELGRPFHQAGPPLGRGPLPPEGPFPSASANQTPGLLE